MGTLARISTRIFLLVVVSALLLTARTANAQCTFTNGDFETGTLTGWTTYTRTTTGGNWFNYTGTTTPAAIKPISAPPQGTRAAVADQLGPITQTIYQNFTLPAGQSGTLSFYVYYNNTHTTFLDFNSLDYLIGSQLYRIDLMKTTAGDESVAASDVYLNLFRTKAGDPLVLAPTLMTYDISGFAGLTGRLRFAASVDQNYFPAAFDNVCLSTTRGTLTRPTATGTNVLSNFGGVTVRFPTVTAAGTTSLQQLDPAVAQVGPPVGATFIGPAYSITSTATATVPLTVCMILPGITDNPTFQHLRMLSKQGGIWVDLPSSTINMTNRQLCATVPTLSQVTAAVSSLAPSAAPTYISGKVLTPEGAPLAGVTMNLGGAVNRKTITDSNGEYRFEGVNTAEFYTVTPSRPNYNFGPTERSYSLLASVSDAAFMANSTGASTEIIDTADYFVRQHYLDFLSREPDESGFAFWTDQLLSCAGDADCLERRRINVSAAYFKSIEFQETGGLVDKLYRASYGRRPLYAEFMPDLGVIGDDVVVGRTNWTQQLETNKQAFVDAWMQRGAFAQAYAQLNNETYVDTLIGNAGGFNGDRNALVNGLNVGSLTRAAALRQIAENPGFVHAKANEMFVMMEYFGYLRRDPDQNGFAFWLNKLNKFNGNFERAEMVKAFIVSAEYRNRFGQ